MYNPGPDYLSAGESALPALYLASFLAFAAALGAWVWFMLQHKGQVRCAAGGGSLLAVTRCALQVHRIHLVMAALLLVKCMSLLFHSTMYHYIQRHGVPAVGWNTAYYVFASLKGVMMFTAIVLVGTGWSLVKVRPPSRARRRAPCCPVSSPAGARLPASVQPFLSVTEKRLLVLVLSLQVLDNVAMVVAEDAAPAAAALETWISAAALLPWPRCCRRRATAVAALPFRALTSCSHPRAPLRGHSVLLRRPVPHRVVHPIAAPGGRHGRQG